MIKGNNNGNGNGHYAVELLKSKPEDIATLRAPISDWSEMIQGEHCAQFYDTDIFLLNSLSDFVSTGLSAGDAVIVVATKPHREGLAELLGNRGLDLDEASAA